MENIRISKNCDAFIYNDLGIYTTNVFLIEKKSKVFLIDTFCGSDSMIPIKEVIKNRYNNKEVIVINTHFHWDHVWGNASFKENIIIGHEQCRELLDKYWEEQLNKNEKYISGNVEKYLPNLTFKENINFEDEGIEIFYSPGHTINLTEEDIYQMIEYLNDLKNGNKIEFEDEHMRKIHMENYNLIHGII